MKIVKLTSWGAASIEAQPIAIQHAGRSIMVYIDENHDIVTKFGHHTEITTSATGLEVKATEYTGKWPAGPS